MKLVGTLLSILIPLLANLKIPRWWNAGVDDVVDEQLHIFCDAAATGYGAVAYRQVQGSSGAIAVTIICARSHVIPLNPARALHHNSIPRLELTAAEKAVEIRLFIQRAAKGKFQRCFL